MRRSGMRAIPTARPGQRCTTGSGCRTRRVARAGPEWRRAEPICPVCCRPRREMPASACGAARTSTARRTMPAPCWRDSPPARGAGSGPGPTAPGASCPGPRRRSRPRWGAPASSRSSRARPASGAAGAAPLVASPLPWPRLRPWLDEMLGQQRLRLQQSGVAQVEVERTLWQDLSRWLLDFEALPQFAVSAIAVTLEDETLHQVDAEGAQPIEVAGALSPERAVSELETLLSDPAFALALHCIDVRLRPGLAVRPELARVPESDCFALLHASARPQPALTAQVAVTLVLHLLSSGWARHPSACRHAALRLFLAAP